MDNNTSDSNIFSDSTYNIVGKLGEGGSGEVYKAWHTRLQKYVVIKQLFQGSGDLTTQRNEVEALKNVKSAYLPQVFDFITQGDKTYTVMEFIEGESLDKLLASGQRFTQTQVVRWYGQLASALEIIHGKGIAHRDIKPGNIMLTPSGDVCLIDFNAAVVRGNDVQLISRSLGYASPEQYEIYERYKNATEAPIRYAASQTTAQLLAEAQTQVSSDAPTEIVTGQSAPQDAYAGDSSEAPTELVGPAVSASEARTELVQQTASDIDWKLSDIYSLGASMYHLLTGKRPPVDGTAAAPVLEAGDFGEAIAYIIDHSMQIDPKNRFKSASDVLDALRNIKKYDSRWKKAQLAKNVAAAVLPLAFAGFAALALLGRNVMATEREQAFYDATYAIESSNDPVGAFDDAVELIPNRLDPYAAMVSRLWADGDMEGAADFIAANWSYITVHESDPDCKEALAQIYYIDGNCYYYTGSEPDYVTAKDCFLRAINLVNNMAEYYADYSVTLARTGEIQEAESALETAESLGLGNSYVDLLEGEIAYAKEEYSEALGHFEAVYTGSADDYLRYRAYHSTYEIYNILGTPGPLCEILESAMTRIPQGRIPEMTEYLADSYAKSGQTGKAIETFERLADTSMPQFHILYDLVQLYESAGRIDEADAQLEQMAGIYPEDYRIPMQQAFVEITRQSELDNDKRDYTRASQYYDSACDLYASHVKPGDEDPDMSRLETAIEQLRDYGWIE